MDCWSSTLTAKGVSYPLPVPQAPLLPALGVNRRESVAKGWLTLTLLPGTEALSG